MKRLAIGAMSAIALIVGTTSAHADFSGTFGDSITRRLPDVSNPPPSGDSRHVCVIHDGLDWYRCVYIPMP